MPKLLRFASLLTAALATAGTACVTDVIVDDGIGAAVKVGLDDDFALAAQRHGVPVDVLKAVPTLVEAGAGLAGMVPGLHYAADPVGQFAGVRGGAVPQLAQGQHAHRVHLHRRAGHR